jgi:hypothetical protein
MFDELKIVQHPTAKTNDLLRDILQQLKEIKALLKSQKKKEVS